MNTLRVTSGSNNALTTEQMRRKVIKYLGSNIILVGFQVCLALFALQLPISAERVGDLSVEPAFVTLTCNLAPWTTNLAALKKHSSKSRRLY